MYYCEAGKPWPSPEKNLKAHVWRGCVHNGVLLNLEMKGGSDYNGTMFSQVLPFQKSKLKWFLSTGSVATQQKSKICHLLSSSFRMIAIVSVLNLLSSIRRMDKNAEEEKRETRANKQVKGQNCFPQKETV